MKMRIKSIEVIGATNRNVFAIGHTINGKKLAEIRLEERFIADTPQGQYVGFDKDGLILFTISATANLVVEYIYEED